MNVTANMEEASISETQLHSKEWRRTVQVGLKAMQGRHIE